MDRIIQSFYRLVFLLNTKISITIIWSR